MSVAKSLLNRQHLCVVYFILTTIVNLVHRFPIRANAEIIIVAQT